MGIYKPLLYTYGTYKMGSLAFGDSTFRGLPSDVVNTAGNIGAMASIAGWGLNIKGKGGVTTGSEILKKVKNYRSPNARLSSKFASVLENKDMYIASRYHFGTKGSIFDVIKTAKKAWTKEVVTGEEALKYIYGSAKNRSSRFVEGALEATMKFAPKTFKGALGLGAGLFFGSMLVGSALDRITGARRRY